MPFLKDAWGSSQYERNLQVGFNIGGPSLIDIRLVLTKEQMMTVDDHVMPPKYFAFCIDNNQIYYYDKSLKKYLENDPNEVKIGKFRRLNAQLSDVQDQYGHTLVDKDSHIAKIYVAKRLSDLINDHDSEGYEFVTSENVWEYVKFLSDSEQGIFSKVATTGDYNDLLNLPFIPDDAIYVNYFDPNGVFDELNGGTGNQDITVKQALDAISAAFTDEDVLPIIIETGDSESTHKIRHKAEKLEIEDKPFIAFKLNVSDLYNDAHYTSKEYVDSENIRQDIEIAKRQHNLQGGNLYNNVSGDVVTDSVFYLEDTSEDFTWLHIYLSPISYTGEYADIVDKPIIHTKRKDVVLEKSYDDDGNYNNDLTEWLKNVDIEDYSSEYVRLRNVVEGSEGVLERLDIIENSELPSKQDKLIAGDNIQIASDGATIRAVDTKYEAGYNVVIDATSDGELFIINTKDSRYLAGDNIVITSEGEDSEGKLYRVSATDTKYFAGNGISIDNQNYINVLPDGRTIKINDNFELYASAIGQYGAKSPIDLFVEGSEEDQIGYIYLQYDSETLKYDSEKGLYVAFNNILDTSAFTYSEGKLQLALIDDPIYYSTRVSNSEGYHIEVRFDKKTISYSPSKGLYLNLDPSIYVDSEGKLTATGKVNIAGDGIKVVGSEGTYTIGFNLADNTLAITPDSKLKGNYQAGSGIVIDGNVIKHKNSIAKGFGGDINKIPVFSYDSEGHICDIDNVTIYAPVTPGERYQYYISLGSEAVSGDWVSFDEMADSESDFGISSKGVYNELQKKQNLLTQASASEGIIIYNDGIIGTNIDNKTIVYDSMSKLHSTVSVPEFIRFKLLPNQPGEPEHWESKVSGTTTYYIQTISEGIDRYGNIIDLADYMINEYKVPIITLDEVTNPDDAIKLYTNWNKIYDTTIAAEGVVKFYSLEVPAVVIPLKCIVFRTIRTSEG